MHNDTIIGEGWHLKAGKPHAEVNAIENFKEKSGLSESEIEKTLKNATIYVSLEPCSHFGKTPPCADLIINNEIKKVVIGSTDPNPEVSGRGIQKLIIAGIDVVVGILNEECDLLNKRFFTFHKLHRPYIFLKWARTADGFIAPGDDSRSDKKEPVWITNEFSRQLAHKMRAEEQAILVGTNTVLMDNPSLTTRDWSGTNPVRIILDKDLKISDHFSVYDSKSKSIFITEKSRADSENIQYKVIDFSENVPKQICEILYNAGIQSVIIEGGAKTIQSFIDANLWDEAHIFNGKTTFGSGVKSPVIKGKLISEEEIKTDTLQIFKNTSI